jgi:hypothetical protein
MEELLQYFIREGAAWARSQRDILRPGAVALSSQLKKFYSAHFAADTLSAVRLCFLPVIPNPTFYADLGRRGISIPLDFTQMEGITYDDTFVITQSSSNPNVLAPLLFHECVHVAQYKCLGVDGFMEQYVRGWVDNGLDYFSIPLEREAYELQRRFTEGEPFSVDEELAGA